MKALPIVLAGLALSSCVARGSGQAPLVANVAPEGDGCRVTVDEQRVTQRQLLDIARRSPGRHGIVVFARNSPYKCIGAAIFTMQQAGLQSVDAASWNGG
jgi:hypothetical protein